MTPIDNPAIAAVFASYPPKPRRKLMALRELIFRTARSTPGVGALEETLKWGQPAYVTAATGSGTTLRIDWRPPAPGECSLYVHCQTTLIADARRQFPDAFTFDGNRRIVFAEDDALPRGPLASVIAAALTYHEARKKRRSKPRRRALEA